MESIYWLSSSSPKNPKFFYLIFFKLMKHHAAFSSRDIFSPAQQDFAFMNFSFLFFFCRFMFFCWSCPPPRPSKPINKCTQLSDSKHTISIFSKSNSLGLRWLEEVEKAKSRVNILYSFHRHLHWSDDRCSLCPPETEREIHGCHLWIYGRKTESRETKHTEKKAAKKNSLLMQMSAQPISA